MRLLLVGCLALLWASATFSAHVLYDLSGHAIPLEHLKNKWIVINYWASWCHTCVDEIPELNQFYQKNRKRALLFAVNVEDLPPLQQQQLIKSLHIHYPSLKNDPALLLNLGDIRGVPVTFVFNPQGQLRHKLYGGQQAAALEKLIGNP